MPTSPDVDSLDFTDDSNPWTETERRNIETFKSVLPHWNNRDADAILAHYDDEITWFNVPMQEVYQGKAAVGKFLRELFVALPDLTLEVRVRFPRGKYIAEQYVIRGTHRGPLFGIPPTGRSVEIPAISLVEFRAGLLKEDHFYYDGATVMRQMGLLPEVEWTYSRLGRIAMWFAAKTRRKPKKPRKPTIM